MAVIWLLLGRVRRIALLLMSLLLLELMSLLLRQRLLVVLLEHSKPAILRLRVGGVLSFVAEAGVVRGRRRRGRRSRRRV